MVCLAGIVHPNLFKTTEQITKLTPAFFGSPTISFQSTRYKNLELGVWDGLLASNKRKSVWAMIEGVIHNSSAIISELKQESGYQFYTHTDAELLVHAYEAWGENFLEKINGDFAIAVFDEEKETLYVVRDRLGKKNIYWSLQGDYLLFSTEIKTLLSTGMVAQTPSVEGLASYLYFGFIPQDFSPIQGINKLLPSHFLKVDLKRRVTVVQYWSLSTYLGQKKVLDQKTAYQEFGNLFEEAVRSAIPEVKYIGALLLDNPGSGALIWYLSHLIDKERLLALSAGIEENPSRQVSSLLGIHQESSTLHPNDVFSDLVKIVWHLDDPISSFQTLAIWKLGKMAAGRTTCVFGDAGWSELLAGSSRYFSPVKISSSRFSIPQRIAEMKPKIRNKYVMPLVRFLHLECKWKILRNIDINRSQVAYLQEIALFQERERKKVSPYLFRFFDPEIFTQRFHRLPSIYGSIDPFLYFDAKTLLPDNTLTQYERLLAPHGLNFIAPYLDHRLVQWIAHLPASLKFPSQEPAGFLRNYLKNLCHQCPEFKERDEPFLEVWCTNPQFRSLFSKLEKGFLVEEGFIKPQWIRQQLGYPYLIPRTFKQLWALLILEIWFRLFIAKPIGSVPLEVDVREFLE